jgi:hypothetical protein
MATKRPIETLGMDYVRRYTAAYREGSDAFHREILCEDVQFPAVLVPPRPSDLLAGKRIYPEVGYSVQYGGLGYYANFAAWDASIKMSAPSAGELAEWQRLRAFWEVENTMAKCDREFPAEIRQRLPDLYDRAESLAMPALPLFRMAGLQLDYGKLVKHGVAGLEELIWSMQTNPPGGQAAGFYDAALASLGRLRRCIGHYHREAERLEAADPVGPASALRKALVGLLEHAPETTDAELHLALTGVPLAPILETLDFLVSRGAQILVRCPMIPGLNDGEDHLAAIAAMERRYPSLAGIEILPWHTMGNSKYAKLGKSLGPGLPAENVSEETKNRYRNFFAGRNCGKVRIS